MYFLAFPLANQDFSMGYGRLRPKGYERLRPKKFSRFRLPGNWAKRTAGSMLSDGPHLPRGDAFAAPPADFSNSSVMCRT